MSRARSDRPSAGETRRERVEPTTPLTSRFHDPALLAIALVAFELAAVMAAPREIEPDLLSRARRGRIPRPTKAERVARRQGELPPERSVEVSAFDRALYERRAASRAPGETVRARLGHERPGAGRSMPALLDTPPRWADFDGLARAEARRLGRYWHLVRQLAEGKLAPTAFQRRVAAWRPFRGETLLADPGTVIAFVEERRVVDEEIFYYERSRP